STAPRLGASATSCGGSPPSGELPRTWRRAPRRRGPARRRRPRRATGSPSTGCSPGTGCLRGPSHPVRADARRMQQRPPSPTRTPRAPSAHRTRDSRGRRQQASGARAEPASGRHSPVPASRLRRRRPRPHPQAATAATYRPLRGGGRTAPKASLSRPLFEGGGNIAHARGQLLESPRRITRVLAVHADIPRAAERRQRAVAVAKEMPGAFPEAGPRPLGVVRQKDPLPVIIGLVVLRDILPSEPGDDPVNYVLLPVVMVPEDENLAAVETGKDRPDSRFVMQSEGEIPEMVDDVLVPDDLVPGADQELVHLPRGIERPRPLQARAEHERVTEVRVGGVKLAGECHDGFLER